MEQVVISCAGDSELAKRVYNFLASKFSSPQKIILSVEEDAVRIQDKELRIEDDDIRKSLDEFVATSSDLAGYSIIGSRGIFAIGMKKNLEEIGLLSCEMCGYLSLHESDLMVHRRTHAAP